MRNSFLQLLKDIQADGTEYIVIDEDDTDIILLVPEKYRYINVMKKNGFHKIKQNEKDLYLYGMTPFQYFVNEGLIVCVCNQVACRSTLNGEWVPLDRKINLFVFDNICKTDADINILCPEDDFCYLLAKSVYTNKSFSDLDIEKIKKDLEMIDEEKLLPKLEGVFFKFTKQILLMCKENRFNEIVKNVWSFSEY